MRILDVVQGTEEWRRARMGIPTASAFDRIVTPRKRTPSAQSSRYIAQLVTEWWLDQPQDWSGSAAMDRGTGLEAEARRWYEFHRGVEVREVGLVLADDGQVGGSPDGLVDEGPDGPGGVEIKCPLLHTHIHALLYGLDDHIGQVQGLMWLTDRAWWDLVSYCPGIEPLCIRVERDEEYIRALRDTLYGSFLPALSRAKERLEQIAGRGPAPPPTPTLDDIVDAARSWGIGQ